LAKLSIDPLAIPNFSLNEGILRYKGKLLIGDDSNLKTQLVEAYHKSAFEGHSGERATLKRMQLIFYRPHMQQQVQKYVKTCPVLPEKQV
jgi:hypothetical protein